jgi:hypothetical protein
MAGHRYGDSEAEYTLNHHSLNPYGRHGMVWQHHLLSHASKEHHLCPKFEAICQKFWQWQLKRHGWAQMETQEINRHWIYTHWTHIWRTWNGLEASSSVTCLHTTSGLPVFWGNLLNVLPISFQKVAWLGTDTETQELNTHWIITHWTHMEDMEWFGSIIFCHMLLNTISFAQNLQ